ncbi:probable phospholipid hydroperoxide glutathione peroxidase 6, mitochondrial [Olea europaea var. sylvestris]|uniref:probable phospholipid hydroperoxide glutathione peroxidase 6, mitochondrial n=1 Tax=Olea europaea var. sylvestris TaxID=158386 RepID=UPI000C1CD10E|nr:probable phospholipid hydroperoxide glutathione peroxidase 6, mitochondrial [Olea europaea var. sylvestris]
MLRSLTCSLINAKLIKPKQFSSILKRIHFSSLDIRSISLPFQITETRYLNYSAFVGINSSRSGFSSLRLVRKMASQSAKPQSVHEFTVKDAKGNDVNLGMYKGKVLLIVNVASQWYSLASLNTHVLLRRIFYMKVILILIFWCEVGILGNVDFEVLKHLCCLPLDMITFLA